MIDYSLMDETVEKLCDSLINNPHHWVFGTFTFYNKKHCPKIEYWSGIDTSITKISNGISNETIFSHEQGKKIYKAYCIAKSKQASVQQQNVIKSLNGIKQETKPTSITPDKSFWDKFIDWMTCK